MKTYPTVCDQIIMQDKYEVFKHHILEASYILSHYKK